LQPQSAFAGAVLAKAQQVLALTTKDAAWQLQLPQSQISQLQEVPSQSGQWQSTQPQTPAAGGREADCPLDAQANVKTVAANSSANNENRFIANSY
jgi:hypothetical protein